MAALFKFVATVIVTTAALVSLVFLIVRIFKSAERGSATASLVGWALMFLSAGINPRPPPQEQVEEANRQNKIKKTVESGDPE
jgi:hypothetical protein